MADGRDELVFQLLLALALGDVARDFNDANDIAVGAADWRFGRRKPQSLAVWSA